MRFDGEKAELVIENIRAGSYPQVAAEAAGIPRQVFLDWLERGEHSRARGSLRTFAAKIRQAAAAARMQAEIELKDKDPRFWLKHGPGRETPDYPGWAGEVKPADLVDPDALPAVDGPEWNRLCYRILTALEPFPEARLALAELLKGMTTDSESGHRGEKAGGKDETMKG